MDNICKEIKKSFINDYWTAGYKAEVSFDTLLTPVIEQIMNQNIENKSGEIKYITKEFPILLRSFTGNNSYGFGSVNVDYVLSDDQTVYFVELKTTMDSYNDTQNANYSDIYKTDHMFKQWGDDFIRLLNHNSSSGKGDDTFQELFNNKSSSNNREILKKLFVDICKRSDISADSPNGNSDYYQKKAIEYLKKRNADGKLSGSNKTLFQAGQILDYCFSTKYELWGKSIKIIYLAPSDKDSQSFINLLTALDDLSSIPYCDWLQNIIKEIFTIKKSE